MTVIAKPAAPRESRPAAGPPAVDVRGLTKRYGRGTVVDNLSITVPAGVVAGFVGPNGAGKTTTLRMLLGLVRPSAGEGAVLGEPLRHPAKYLPRVGALIEGPALYPTLSGRRNLTSLAVLAGQDPASADGILERVGLAGRGDDAFRTYSLGMKQRLAIGAALLSDPELLVLDEPTNGLDPAGIRQMRDLVRSLADAPGRDGARARARARTVLVSSHLLAEVEQICDWIIVLDRGRLAYQGPTEGFMTSATSRVALRPEDPAALGMLADLVAGLGLPGDRIGDRLLVELDRTARVSGAVTAAAETTAAAAAIAGVSRAAHARGITLVEISWQRASLEERYQGLVEGQPADPARSATATTATAATATAMASRVGGLR
ncbi:ABC-2 type transport system ATP-binding protein [Frankia sp. EI5c]|uniref:ABC transporter ATP-binding protein n=1 Tax=Frankia sp. EI5c TaxID=683316 RepID=UPI0007C37DB4|nr:ATP-binding cassette domain-containing protein [Frankia sp. EI5c]OAA25632.1 ABC-2 type transport system ATP-binding protein [Frankia sp. EI5c]